MKNPLFAGFAKEAERILNLDLAIRVNRLGGYGPDGEVVYDAHPDGCPSVLVTTAGAAKATFMSNGSIAFEVKLAGGLDVPVLSGHFDTSEKRETGVPSNNLWLRLRAGRRAAPVAALINPGAGGGCEARATRVVKLGDPRRAIWYCADFAPLPGLRFSSAVKFRLVATPAGPALLRLLYLRNSGRKPLEGDLWSFFNLRGAQRFVYNKEIWYDAGLPVTPAEIVVSATVPYSEIVQPKRLSTATGAGLRMAEATCDYTAFLGDSACGVHLPRAVREGRLRPGAGQRLNRFSIATIAAGRCSLRLAPGKSTCLLQQLLYVGDEGLCERFRQRTACRHPDYPRVERAFRAAAAGLVRGTPALPQTLAAETRAAVAAAPAAFAVALPRQPAVSAYARSLWTGVAEIYENCRAHGARMAQGIELGTRDRAQDMWPMMKEDPARVRADLVHALGFMYVTVGDKPRWSRPLTRVEKLHGMFPRQYPSRWDDRAVEVKNDNRPYNDSAVWLVDALNMYIRETGDGSILRERVPTVRLTAPETPERSGIVGARRTLPVSEVLLEIFEAYRRHAEDSPYGLVQTMYGDWCDPFDMMGTSRIGDTATRGAGRGVQVRLSAHVFASLVATLDLLEAPRVAATLTPRVAGALPRLRALANGLRRQALRWAWEEGPRAGFILMIHELRADGARPDYARGEKGYTVGSMSGGDFDGARRRDVSAQAYGLRMLQIERDWLDPVPGAAARIAAILATCDRMLFDPKLGLRLLQPAIANNETACRLVGRMGVLPAGCAENGEYHHGQMMMHRFRLLQPGQADNAWRQFLPMISAMRDTSLAGPFDMPATSYASDPADPHFGKGMYFGLSGSTDWIVEFLQHVAGLDLALHDERLPAVRVTPRLPAALRGEMTLRRVIHVAREEGGFRRLPLTLTLLPAGRGGKPSVTVNGRPAPTPEVASLKGLDRLEIVIRGG